MNNKRATIRQALKEHLGLGSSPEAEERLLGLWGDITWLCPEQLNVIWEPGNLYPIFFFFLIRRKGYGTFSQL